jgi:hypothetical protein
VANPRMEHLKGAPIGLALALAANLRLDWKGLKETNTLAYYENPYFATVKSFEVQAPVL